MSSTFFVPARTWLLRISNSFLCVVTSRRAPANPQVLKRMTSATWAAVAGAVEEPIPALAVARAPRVPAGGVAPRPAAVPTRASGNGAAPSGGGEGGSAEYRPRFGVRQPVKRQCAAVNVPCRPTGWWQDQSRLQSTTGFEWPRRIPHCMARADTRRKVGTSVTQKRHKAPTELLRHRSAGMDHTAIQRSAWSGRARHNHRR